VFGDERQDANSARALAQQLANLLIDTNHVGKSNSGLLPLYPHANTQGVFDMIDREQTSSDDGRTTDVAWLIGVGDADDAPQAKFTIVQDILLSELAKRADVVLPALSFAEREGTFTSGDRRVQRFYRALPPMGNAKPDWWIVQEVAKRMGAMWTFGAASQIFAAIANEVSRYEGLSIERISKSEAQWPPVGRNDLYYGGTAYDSDGGVGARYASDNERGMASRYDVQPTEPTIGALERQPRKLYQAGDLIRRSKIVDQHLIETSIVNS
jgi:NADH-quinone oxidoreductase subunit G